MVTEPDIRRSSAAHQLGFSLVEMLIGVMVFATIAVVLGNHVTTSYSAINSQRDKVFAYTKAQALLSEIHAFVDSGEIGAAIDLDVLDDGVIPQPQLTITTDDNGALLAPEHPLSANIMRDGAWVWSRQISVRPFAGIENRNVRYVTVRVFKQDLLGNQRELASLSSVVNSVGSAFPTTQVFDVYLLAIENIPGWWVYMEAIIPFVESAITDLENRNPGLSVRTHWITKAGYGRNPLYRPNINEAVDSHSAGDGVYLYPGLMPSGNSSTYYYVPSLINGQMTVDGAEANSYDADTNPYPYSLTDFYNHAMRYPRAKAYHDARVTAIQQRKAAIRAAQAAGVAAPAEFDDMSEEPPLQILLEEMASDPDRYRNALVINLHGELVPFPALNNVSTPAKDPAGLPYVRVVTHPEELRTARPDGTISGDIAAFRVYAYKSDPNAAVPDKMPISRPIELRVMDMDLTNGGNSLNSDVRLFKIEGGVSGSSYDSGWASPVELTLADVPALLLGKMGYHVEFVDPGDGQQKYTRFKLYNTPVVCEEHVSGGDAHGLSSATRARLYGMEYNPAPVQGTDFATDLTTTRGEFDADRDAPRNTARWRLQISPGAFGNQRFVQTSTPVVRVNPLTTTEADRVLTVQTRIYQNNPVPLNSATPVSADQIGSWPSGANSLWVQPENFSETYTWWADSPEDVPITERSQFLGDPRHNPYKDLLDGDPDFSNRYCWYHDDLTSSSRGDARSDFPGLRRLGDRWHEVRADVPRYFELLRFALSRTNSIYTTLTGYSYYYMGIGNEIGYDSANGYGSSIPNHLDPWGTGSTGFVNNITGSRCYVRNAPSSGNNWVGLPWLGEFYPDAAYPIWSFIDTGSGDTEPSGNMAVGATDVRLYRERDQDAYQGSMYEAYGTDINRSFQRLNTYGCVSFFNNGSSGAHFNHHPGGGTGTLTSVGQELADNYGFPVPVTTEINRPFALDTGGNVPSGFSEVEYSGARYSASLLEEYYDRGSRIGSGLVQLTDPTGNDAALIIVNGLAQTTTTGTSVIAKYCLLSMFQSFFELGESGLSFRFSQPPRVEILEPTEITELNDPSSITVSFATEWVRWDGQPYTESTPVSFSEDEAEIEYVIMYSRDNGVNWLYVQDNSPGEIGELPSDPTYRIADTGVGDETYTWTTPEIGFPSGTYLLRVEAYRVGQSLHYSQHQSRVFIQR